MVSSTPLRSVGSPLMTGHPGGVRAARQHLRRAKVMLAARNHLAAKSDPRSPISLAPRRS